jgi:hypothetical protein
MAKVHGFRRRTSSCVEIEWLSTFIAIEDKVKISMGEEDLSSQHVMGSFSSEFFNSGEQVAGDLRTAESGYELVVIYSLGV